MTRIVTVTQSDIDKGFRGSPDKCPLALALHREYLGRWLVVSDLIIELDEDNTGRVSVWHHSSESYQILSNSNGGYIVSPAEVVISQ